MEWRLTLDLTGAWKTGDVPAISAAAVSGINGLDLSFLPGDDHLRVVLLGIRDDFERLMHEEDPDVDDLDATMEDLYDWADTPLPGHGKLCWVATIF